MRIASVKLKNFKRFTDLELADIPQSAKLVVVVGPNGCGKSSLFDAFNAWYRQHIGYGQPGDMPYYQKDSQQGFSWAETVKISLHGNPSLKPGMLYIRTAYRNDPEFRIDGINRPDDPAQNIRVNRTIENDAAVSDNYRRLVYETMTGVYDEKNDSKTVLALREELIGSVRESMQRVFGDLLLNSISDPLGTGAFYFQKGTVKTYNYRNLSGGEKAAFDLILDFHIKKCFFNDAVYCIDEIETHLHTRVQGLLVRELVRIVPSECQLWLTTHSLGVLRAAQEMMISDRDSVCVVDFHGVDPDIPHKLLPSNLGRVTWDKLLSVALDDLSTRVVPKKIVICEGSSVGTRRKDFDAEIYNRVLASRHSDVLFVSGGSSSQVNAAGISVNETLKQLSRGSGVTSLADRDDKSEEEVKSLEARGTYVLPVRNLESFLFADDVIDALVKKEQKPELREAALQVKKQALANSVGRNNPADDLKSAAGEIYVELKKLLGLKRCGNDKDSFMRDTLAPLITPSMPTYESMKKAIVDRL